MSDDIQITAEQREPIELESLGLALLELVEGLEVKTKKRLTSEGLKLLNGVTKGKTAKSGRTEAAA